MPIALPAPLPPVQGTADIIKSEGSPLVSASVKDTQVHVIGPDTVDKSQLEGALSTAVDLSDAVRQVQAVYYAAGYPAVKVTYALVAPDLYVLVQPNKLAKVEAPAPYESYFSDLPSADPLTDADLEPARIMASLHADRAGESVVPEFKSDADTTVLRLVPSEGPSQSSMGVGFGNPGNRFSGRYFIDYFGAHGFKTGDELRATGRHATTGLNDADASESYYEHTLSWSRVMAWGLVGVTGRNVGYQQDLDVVGFPNPLSFDGKIRQGELSFTHLLAADFNSRWTVGAKGDYTYKNFDTTEGNEVVQRQEYASVELNTDYTRVFNPFGFQTEVSGGLAVRSGLGDDETGNPIRGADFGYLLVRPTLGARTVLNSWSAVSLRATGQYSGDTLPEQQQWVMGGIGNVEAYLPAVAVGDSGGVARLQFEISPMEMMTVRIKPRLFAEYGFTRFEETLPGQQDQGEQTLADAGVAIGFEYGKYLEAAVSYAESFEEDGFDQRVLDDADANVFFQVGAKF